MRQKAKLRTRDENVCRAVTSFTKVGAEAGAEADAAASADSHSRMKTP